MLSILTDSVLKTFQDKLSLSLTEHGIWYNRVILKKWGVTPVESAKSRALHAKNVSTCQRALHAYVFTCHRALHAYVLTCQHALRAYVVTWQCTCVLACSLSNMPCLLTCLNGNMPCGLTCSLVNVPCMFMGSHVNVPYVLTSLRALKMLLSFPRHCLCNHVMTCQHTLPLQQVLLMPLFFSFTGIVVEVVHTGGTD